MSNRERLKLPVWSSPVGKRWLIHCRVQTGVWVLSHRFGGQPWCSHVFGVQLGGSHPSGVENQGDKAVLTRILPLLHQLPAWFHQLRRSHRRKEQQNLISVIKARHSSSCALGKQNWWVRRCHFHAVTFLHRTAYSCYGSSSAKTLIEVNTIYW